MSSNLACVGLAVAGPTELTALVTRALAQSTVVGRVGDVVVRRWEDPSGARLVLGVGPGGEVVDLLPSWAGAPGGRLANCRPVDDEVAIADVVDEDGEQWTQLACAVEQARALTQRATPAEGPATVVALGVDVSVHRDAAAFAASSASLLDPAADPDAEPPPGLRGPGAWPMRLGEESFLSYGVFGGPAAAEPFARLSGTVLAAERRVVALTGQDVVTARVRTVGFEAELCLEGSVHRDLPLAGQVVSGTVYLVVDLPGLGFGQDAAVVPGGRWWRRGRAR